jgi:peptidoglycan/xylan/chitin deacetylase (PgdA/CDA1 family)
MFHQVNNDNRPIYKGTPVKTFEMICAFMSKYANVIHFSEIGMPSLNNKKPTVIISFDDGHYDIIENALPILQKYNLKFNVNIDTEILDTKLPQDNVRVYDILNQTTETKYSAPKYFKNTIVIQKDTSTEIQFSEALRKLEKKERREFSNHLFETIGNQEMKFSKVLAKDDVRHLNKYGAEIGSHGHSHSMLINQSQEDILFELEYSKKILEEIIQNPILIIAYPNGLANTNIDAISRKLNYEYFLYTKDLANNMKSFDKEKIYRINMYHQSFEESLANIFGVHRRMHSFKKLIS